MCLFKQPRGATQPSMRKPSEGLLQSLHALPAWPRPSWASSLSSSPSLAWWPQPKESLSATDSTSSTWPATKEREPCCYSCCCCCYWQHHGPFSLALFLQLAFLSYLKAVGGLHSAKMERSMAIGSGMAPHTAEGPPSGLLPCPMQPQQPFSLGPAARSVGPRPALTAPTAPSVCHLCRSWRTWSIEGSGLDEEGEEEAEEEESKEKTEKIEQVLVLVAAVIDRQGYQMDGIIATFSSGPCRKVEAVAPIEIWPLLFTHRDRGQPGHGLAITWNVYLRIVPKRETEETVVMVVRKAK